MISFRELQYRLDCELGCRSWHVFVQYRSHPNGQSRTKQLRFKLFSENYSIFTSGLTTEQDDLEQVFGGEGVRKEALFINGLGIGHASRPIIRPTVAALYVAKDGAYANLPGVDLWDQARDARRYAGPHPVVCHSPCQRWGRFWHGSTRKPHQFKLGDDDGCFAAALAAVRQWGGVLEHPADSHAWAAFDLNRPPRAGGWVAADFEGGWTCHVEQGFYGHFSRKPTWLYAAHVDLPPLRWGRGEQRLHPTALAKHGYAKARRIGMAAMIGGKHKTEIREATPLPFRDLLLSIASSPTPTTRSPLPLEEGR